MLCTVIIVALIQGWMPILTAETTLIPQESSGEKPHALPNNNHNNHSYYIHNNSNNER